MAADEISGAGKKSAAMRDRILLWLSPHAFAASLPASSSAGHTLSFAGDGCPEESG